MVTNYNDLEFYTRLRIVYASLEDRHPRDSGPECCLVWTMCGHGLGRELGTLGLAVVGGGLRPPPPPASPSPTPRDSPGRPDLQSTLHVGASTPGMNADSDK